MLSLSSAIPACPFPCALPLAAADDCAHEAAASRSQALLAARSSSSFSRMDWTLSVASSYCLHRGVVHTAARCVALHMRHRLLTSSISSRDFMAQQRSFGVVHRVMIGVI